ncbi:hypothetical protein H6P81_005551 [Aristolochia fimbriata]|uniref:Uncharacterized protein n=1 Tax=Aristolochia fimbriata TaxID=158543 RepID=A0AAV7EUW8_ARIFI|nr:hypothetical protein H6P81_005551 [Aristolochia fimbriata]
MVRLGADFYGEAIGVEIAVETWEKTGMGRGRVSRWRQGRDEAGTQGENLDEG